MFNKATSEYDAFISYSQSDARLASAIQDALHLIGKTRETLNSFNIFRDASHLPLTALEPSIVEALSKSDFLILLASPNSANSDWVRLEIAHFIEVRSPKNILVVLADGELSWDPTRKRYLDVPKTAMPPLPEGVFDTEILYLDLRWVNEETDLSLSNNRFLDAIATIAATLQGISKETIIGRRIEDQRKFLRSQSINLGFRGVVGFLAPALVLWILWSIFVDDESRLLVVSLGFPIVGMLGAFSLGLGLRGVIGFCVGFLLLLFPYFVGQQWPPSNNLLDHAALLAIVVLGFALAGGVGVAAHREVNLKDGASVFAVGGTVAAAFKVGLLFFVDGEPVATNLVQWLWFPTRVRLYFNAAIESADGVREIGNAALWAPFVVGIAVAGFSLGLKLAVARSPIDSAPIRDGGQTSAVRFHSPKFCYGVPGTLLCLVLANFYWASDGYTRSLALKALSAESIEEFTGLREGHRSFSINGLPAILRARNALEGIEQQAKADRVSEVIRRAILEYASSPESFFDEFGLVSPVKFEIDIVEVAEQLSEFGTPEELALLLSAARLGLEAEGVSSAVLGSRLMYARAEGLFGSKNIAEEVLREISSNLVENDWRERSLLAQILFELTFFDKAALEMGGLLRDIETTVERSPGAAIGLGRRLTAESGEVIWHVGFFQDPPRWQNELDDQLAKAVEGLCRQGETELAVALVRDHQTKSGFWHTERDFAKAAADAGHFDTAFSVLDAFEVGEDPGWTYFSNRASALNAIIESAISQKEPPIVAQAASKLEELKQLAQKHGELEQSSLYLAYGFALAGELELAHDVATHNYPRAGLAIARALIRNQVQSPETASLLAEAWRGIQLDSFVGGPELGVDSGLAMTAVALAQNGNFHAALTVLDDFGGGRSLDSITHISVYTAILEHSPK